MSSSQPIISTNAFCQGSFAPHGEFRIQCLDGLFCYEAIGPFNLEAVRALGPARRQALERWAPAAGARVAVLVHWQHSALMSPEAFAAYRAGLSATAQSLAVPPVVAWVAEPELEGMDFMLDRFAEVFSANRVEFQLFTAWQDGARWLRARLAQAAER
ncbi:hypothetical protein [Paucibacter soli]|uniref:hypothetical protein n=1 Tax=Paucibacter soli TaxID=3133433 RepID=UPI00309C5150